MLYGLRGKQGAMTMYQYLAPRPWRVDRESEGVRFTSSCAILDAEGGEVCVLNRGYQGDQNGEGCPSWDNAELIVAAVNAYALPVSREQQ